MGILQLHAWFFAVWLRKNFLVVATVGTYAFIFGCIFWIWSGIRSVLLDSGYWIGQSIILGLGTWLVPYFSGLTGAALPLAPLVPSLGLGVFNSFEIPSLLLHAIALVKRLRYL